MSLSRSRTSANAAPFLFIRQRQLLQLLNALGGSAVDFDFQKLLFLYCQEPESSRHYDFVPHKLGALSFTSYADRRKLIDRGLLVDDEQHWRLTEEGQRIVGRNPDPQALAFASRHRRLRGDALVAETFRRFPYYAMRSELADRVLCNDRAALAHIEAVRAASAPYDQSCNQTIGYEGHTLESYLNALLLAGVTLLCDVRRNPLSRKYGFSKGALSRSCEEVGLRYEHLPALGIASDQRKGLKEQADYDALFEDYERTWLPKQTDSLDKIASWAHHGARVALTCYEHLPHQCHRHCVAEALEARFGGEFTPKHL